MLGIGIRAYEHVFADASSAAVVHTNERQRDINRAFEPVITETMQTAYDQCNAESGQGSFKRMKSAMETYVNQARNTMFQQACQEVRTRLKDMSEELRKSLLDRSEGVFSSMKRDYMSLNGGVDIGHVQIPRGERAAKRELDEVINLMDDEFKKVIDADLEALRMSAMRGEEGGEAVDEGLDDGDAATFESEDDQDDPRGEGSEASGAEDAADLAAEPIEVEDED